jgi:hypothetical protein
LITRIAGPGTLLVIVAGIGVGPVMPVPGVFVAGPGVLKPGGGGGGGIGVACAAPAPIAGGVGGRG